MGAVHLLAVENVLLTEQAQGMEALWDLFFWLAMGVGAFVLALIAWVVVRYRRRAHPVPSKRHENIPIEIAYAVIPLIVVTGLFAVTVLNVEKVESLAAQPDVVVKVTGFQWQWQFDYPAAGARSVGVGSEEPELVLPTGSRVRFDMTSADVIHSFWIPGFRYKKDLFPGRTSSFQVDISEHTGVWRSGACAEFCGLNHDQMRFVLRTVPRDEFDRWAAQHRAPATTGARP